MLTTLILLSLLSIRVRSLALGSCGNSRGQGFLDVIYSLPLDVPLIIEGLGLARSTSVNQQ